MWPWLASAALAADLRTCGDGDAEGCYEHLADAVAASSPGDVITLAAGEYVEAVTITHDLTLVGEPGHALLDPPDVDSVFTVLDADVTLQGLLFMTTRARAVEVADASLTIEGAVFESTSAQYLGGIVLADRSVLVVEDSELYGGTAFQGGQIGARDSDVTLTGTVHDGGRATDAGGCIAIGSFSGEPDPVRISAARVRSCRARSGGGIALLAVDAVIQGTKIEGNAADDGAGLVAVDTTLSATDVNFYANVANEAGGGLIAIPSAGTGSLTLGTAIFEANEALLQGGGVWSAVPTTISATRFVGNESEKGGGVYTEDLRELHTSRFCSNMGWSTGSALYATLTADAVIENTLFGANFHDFWAYGAPVTLVATHAVHADVRFNDFVYNEGSVASAVDLTDAVVATVDFSSNVFAGNVATADPTFAVRPAAFGHRFAYNVWFENGGEGDLPGGWTDDHAAIGDPALDRWVLNDCRWQTSAGEDPAFPSVRGAGVDAGDPAYTDKDGTRADAGHHAGPHADPLWWLDYDGDGWPSVYDCEPEDAAFHPDADDAPYDGVDHDCDFWSDDDADRDGHDSEDHGGDDCDDGDASVNPDATDVPNDGIDQDCVGGDRVDGDGDGYLDPYDCDDGDPSVHPGQAVDDGGVDRDCDGFVGPLRPRGCATASPTGLGALIALLGAFLRRRAVVVAAGALVAARAEAAPACEPLDAAEFRSLVLDAQAAIDLDDASLHEAIVTDTLSRVPCMTFAPPARQWADFLVSVAILEFANGRDWQPALGAALRIRPGVDRGVGAGHPMDAWEPPAASPGTVPVPEGVILWVDGERSSVLPPAEGLFLVQREEDGRWASQIVADRPVDPAWLTERIEVRPTWERWAGASLRLAGSASSQVTPQWDTPYVPDGGWGASQQGAAVRLGGWYGDVGGEIEAMAGLRDFRQVAYDARLTAVARRGAFAFGPGAGVTSVTVSEGDEQHQRLREVATPWAYAAAWHRPDGDWDQAVVVGGGTALARLELRAGRTSGEAPRLRVGGALGAQRAWMSASQNVVRIDQIWLAVEVGAFGGAW